MARAKRTDRAEARRKYRAYLQEQQDAEAAEGQDAATPTSGTGSRPDRGNPRSQSNAQPGAKLGLMAAARAAYHQPTYLRDLKDIRALIFGSHAVWPVIAICVAAGAYLTETVTPDGGTKDATIAPLLFQFIFWPVPLLPPMLAGFLAPRATWLAGALASLISTLTLLVVFAVVGVSLSNAPGTLATATASPAAATPTAVVSAAPSATALLTTGPSSSPNATAAPTTSPAASPSPSVATGTTNTTTSDFTFGVLILLLQSLAFGALMGAGAGWYKRFLAFTSGPRTPSSGRGGQRPSQRRPAPKKKPA